MPIKDDYEFAHISGAATTVISGVACKLINVCVNTAGGTITVYNAPTSVASLSTNVVGLIASATIPGVYISRGIKLASGLVVVTGAGTGDVTVTYATA